MAGTKGAGGSSRHRSSTNRRPSDRSSYKTASSGSRSSVAHRSTDTAGRKFETERSVSSMGQAKKRRRRQNQRRARQRMMLKLAMLGILVLLVWLAVHLSLERAVSKVIEDDKRIAEGITIDGFDVGGMTKEQAVSAFDAYVDSIGKLEITCRTDGGEVAIPISAFGFRQDTTTTKDLVEQAYNYGREGSTIRQYRQIRKLRKGPVDFDATFTIDEELTAQILGSQCKVVEGAAVNAAIVHQGGTRRIIESKNGIVVDTETTTAAIRNIISAADWDKQGCQLDVATYEAEPEITTAMLEALPDELGSYKTQYEGLSAKMQNVENGAGFINGHLLQPGEEFDANAAMEPYTQENGYTEGRSFNSGQIEETIGGGICQVSTTLYNAVLFAELEVVDRSCHSMLVSYVEPGRDAAIADDVKNFVFRNNTKNPVYIEMYTENGFLYAYIYGVEERDPGRTIEYYSDVTSRKECKVTYRADYDAPLGSRETETYGYDGVEATLYKIIYMNGVKQDTELVNYSSYNLVDAVVKVGVKSENEEARSKLLNAIANQDEDVIRSYTY